MRFMHRLGWVNMVNKKRNHEIMNCALDEACSAALFIRAV